MRQSFPRLLCSGLVAGVLIAGCENQNGGGDGPLDPTPPDDLSAFTGAWFIHETGVTNLCPTDNPCREELDAVIAELYSIAEDDSHCVLVDSLHHLILVEPYMSEGVCDGASSLDAASVNCTHEGMIGGDSLMSVVEGDIFPQDAGEAWQASFTIAVNRPGEDDCSCMALVGIRAERRPAGHCDP